MNRVTERQTRLQQEFAALSSWEERYKRLIQYGKQIPKLPASLYDEKFKVKGCQSQVWLHANIDSESVGAPTIKLQADSDALIVKGLAALLVEAYSNATPDEILSSSPTFLKDLGFETHLSPSRANGLYAMLKQIFLYATAFRALAVPR